MMVLVNDRVPGRHSDAPTRSQEQPDFIMMTDTTSRQPVLEDLANEGTANVGEGQRRRDEECQTHNQA